MPRRSKREPGAAGTFRPAPPRDAGDVGQMFAVAARAVCVLPESLDEVSSALSRVNSHLMPPEELAARECSRLWQFFAAAARSRKPTLMNEAGSAFVSDLDRLSQRLDLPPLDAWDRLACALDDPRADATADGPGPATDGHYALVTVRRKARRLLGKKKQLRPAEVVELLADLRVDERERVFEALVGEGRIARKDALLISQRLLTGDRIRADEEALVEVLEKLSLWLTAAGE